MSTKPIQVKEVPTIPRQDRQAAAARVGTLTNLGTTVTEHATKYPPVRTVALAIGSLCYEVAADLRRVVEEGHGDDILFGVQLRADTIEQNANAILLRRDFADHDAMATGGRVTVGNEGTTP